MGTASTLAQLAHRTQMIAMLTNFSFSGQHQFVKHNGKRKSSPFWLAVVLEDVQIEILCDRRYLN